MEDNTPLTREDLHPNLEKEKEYLMDKDKTLDEIYLSELKDCIPFKNMRMLTPAKARGVINNVAKGLSLFTASTAVGVVPSTIAKYMRMGRERYNKACELDFKDVAEFEEYLGEEGRFFIELTKAKSECVMELHDILMDKASEAGKEWIPQWMLQVMEPETYSSKYRIEKMKADMRADVGAGSVGTVQFTFIDGMRSRPPEDRVYIQEKLAQLQSKHGDPVTELTMEEVTESLDEGSEE